jgi:hypothetical protein
MGKKRSLLDEYRFPGFRPRPDIQGIFGDPKARVVRLERSKKKRHAAVVAPCTGAITTRRCGEYGTCLAGTPAYTWKWKSGGFVANGAKK